MQAIGKLTDLLSKPFTPAVFFFAGVTYDTVTLTRIDRLLDNLILLFYLTLLGALIVLTGRAATASADVPATPRQDWTVSALVGRARPYFPNAIQFLLGGLFSAYTIFYFQSASFTTNAVFFAVLVGFLVANEFFRNRLSSLRLLVTLYALVCFSFFTYFLPVLTGVMNTIMFLLGAVLSLAVTLWVVELIYKKTVANPRREKILAGLPAGVLVLLLVWLYFLNWIPPVPLSLKFGGIYHHVGKTGEVYELSFEQPAWYQFWKRSDDPFRGSGPVYCFTAIFAPVDLRTTIYHHWQYQVASGRQGERFLTSDRREISISGGRRAGYRAYTYKRNVKPGLWRVDVETERGRVIGRVSFTVDPHEGPELELETIAY